VALVFTSKVVPSLDDLVNQWKQADQATESATWAKADIALEAVEHYGDVTEFAERIDVPRKTVIDHRYVAKAWPKSARADLPFGAARALAAQSDRFELAKAKNWTAHEALTLVRERKALAAPEPKPGASPVTASSLTLDL
jgi:hypothetical protein